MTKVHELGLAGSLLLGNKDWIFDHAGYRGEYKRDEPRDVKSDWCFAVGSAKINALKQHHRKNTVAIRT